jgi:membrane protein YqaA with SNARE-associated domain
MFETYGIIFLFISAFTPIPYKVFTISAGVLSYNIFLFILISIIGRSARFFLVSFICKKYGEHIVRILNKYLLIIAIFVFLLLILWVKY